MMKGRREADENADVVGEAARAGVKGGEHRACRDAVGQWGGGAAQ